MKINIVMDNKNNWYYKRNASLIKKIRGMGHICRFYFKQGKITTKSDITFFLGHEGYISKATRENSRFNIVVHASDLPKGKGMSPATWQILEDKRKIPVTLFEVADKIDAGDYYLKDNFTVNGTELIDEWQEKLGKCIDKMIIKFIKNTNILKPTKQRGGATAYRRRTQKDSMLNIDKSIKSQFNLLRVVDNEKYPAYFYYKNNKYLLKIYKEKKNKK